METILDLGHYTFPSMLENSVKKFGERPALSLVNGNPITYKEIQEQSVCVAKKFAALGLKPGNKIGLWGTGCPNWGVTYFGIVNYGMIAVPLLPDFSKNEVESIIIHCGVDALVVGEKLYERIKDLGNKLPASIIRLEDYTLIKGDAEAFASADSVELSEYEVKEDDTASIIYTSGTTGRSKGVELSHKSLVWNAVQGQTMHRVNKLDRCLSFLPLSHVYEFTIGFSMQIMNGACVYYLGKPPVVSALIPAFAKVQPTIVCSVPLVMEKIFKSKVLPAFNTNKLVKFLYHLALFRKIFHKKAGKQLKKTFGGHIVFFGIGGAKVDPKVERFMKEAKFPYAIGYGLTETAPLLAGSGPRYTLPGTIGHVLMGVDLKLNNPDPKTGIGEVVVKGPNVMKGYYKDEALTREAFTSADDSVGEGYFRTGDLGSLEKKKGLVRLSLKGRSKNMILGPSGENIYPEDIEFVLNQHPMVNESLVVEDDNGLVALVQVDEEKLEQEVRKNIESKPNLTDIAEEIKRDMAYRKEAILSEIQFFVNTKVNKSSHIGKVQTVDKFEKTASQKIKRYLYDLRTKVRGKLKK